MSMTRDKKPAEPPGGRAVLAWEGWEAPIPENWRPLKIETHERGGSLMLGDAEQAIALIKWWRPPETRFDSDRWMRARLRALGSDPSPNAAPPRPGGFTDACWTRDAQIGRGVAKSVWYGYAPSARLVLELIVNQDVPEPARKRVWHSLLPGLRAGDPAGPGRWSLFDVSFLSPPGFSLFRRRLYAGDITLEFRRGRDILLLRQLYPAELALSRRTPEQWLARYPFQESRRFSLLPGPATAGEPRAPTETWRRGVKRFPFPLGPYRPFQVSAVARRDTRADRLLIAESLSTGARDDKLAAWALDSMNWHLTERAS